jgi:hypothetical protein
VKSVYKDLALGFRKDYEQAVSEIETFEIIFKDKRFSKETKDKAREILTILYEQRDEYGQKAEQYRTLYNASKIGKRVITWR